MPQRPAQAPECIFQFRRVLRYIIRDKSHFWEQPHNAEQSTKFNGQPAVITEPFQHLLVEEFISPEPLARVTAELRPRCPVRVALRLPPSDARRVQGNDGPHAGPRVPEG